MTPPPGRNLAPIAEGGPMNPERFNMSMRKFLKQVGVTAQQEIEECVRRSGKVSGQVKIRAVVTAADIGLNHVVDGEIELG
jgi:hypothetical protein